MQEVPTTGSSTSAAIVIIMSVLAVLIVLWVFGGGWGKLAASLIGVAIFAVYARRAYNRDFRNPQSQEDSE